MRIKQKLTLLSCFAVVGVYAQNVGINNTGTPPFAGAILDVQSNSKGILIPRMTTAEREAMPSLTTGLMVYDTDINQFYYYASGWKTLGSTGWQTSGNAGTNPANEFLGTTDNAAVNFRTNNINWLTLNTNGDIRLQSDQQTLQFTSTNTASNRPMIQMFTTGTQNSDRMVIAHSSAFPTWGLEYRDTADAFYFRSNAGRKFTFELASGQLGIGVENPAYPLDAVGRFRLRSDGNINNSPGIWFANQANTFDRAFIGMSKPDSGLGIYSQHLGTWAIEFEVMREPRVGINTRNGGDGVVRAELHVMHTNFGGSNDGVRIQNQGSNEHYWNLYTSNSTGDFEFYKQGIKRATINQTSGAYTAVSDERLKKNVRLMQSGVLSKVLQLKPTSYQFIDLMNDEVKGFKAGDRFYNGFIAQEVEKIFPELVYRGSDNPKQDFYTMDYTGFGIISIKAIQEQQAIIDKQQAEINQLKNQLTLLTEQVQSVLDKGTK